MTSKVIDEVNNCKNNFGMLNIKYIDEELKLK